MHFLMFQMKRAHLTSLAAAREFCEALEITPARFDLLRAAMMNPEGTPQNEIAKLLGLTRSTVSAMVRRLIEIGLVRRMRAPLDARTFVIIVTEEGVARMRRIWARIQSEQPFQNAYEGAYGTAGVVQEVAAALRASAVHLGDRSAEFYPSRDPEPSERD